MYKSICAVILCFCMIFPLAACSGNGEPVVHTTAAPSTAEQIAATSATTDQWGRPIIEDTVPKNLDFGGKTVNFLTRESGYLSVERYFLSEIYVEQDSSEVVESATYNRNRTVEERLNVTINAIPMANEGDTGMHKAFVKSVMAGLNEYDVIAGYQYYFPTVATEGALYNLKKAPNLDFSKPWWLHSLMDELTIGDKLYFMSGDISQSMIRGAYSLFFNKRIYGETMGDDDLYETVLAGKWTYDRLAAIGKAVYKDLNGDTKPDDGDLYAFGSHTGSMIDCLAASCGIRYTQKDSSGKPEFILNSPRNISIFEKLYETLHETAGILALPPTSESAELLYNKFTSGTLLFFPTILLSSQRLRDMKDDFGIVPLPKLDETQEKYTGATIDNSSLYAIAVNVADIDMVSAVMELMCAEAYKQITPVYYEVALKTKYTRDDVSSQMVDLIRGGIYYDFCMLYSSSINNVGHTPRTIMQGKNKAFVSTVEKLESSVKSKIDELIAAYEALS